MINKDLLIIIHFTLREFFAPTNFTLSEYLASLHCPLSRMLSGCPVLVFFEDECPHPLTF
jgi:hypothetical protein